MWRRLVPPLFLLASACGGSTADPTTTALLPPACPCAVSDDFSIDIVPIGKASYGFGLDRTLRYRKDGSLQAFPSGLDATLCFGGEVVGHTTVVHVAGCRGRRSVVRTFTNREGQDEADSFVGEYELPPAARIVSLDLREDGVLFLLDEAGGQILRLHDDDGDGAPDRHDVYVQSRSEVLSEPNQLYTTRSGLVIVEEGGCIRTGPLFVAADRDGDGQPEWAGEISWLYLDDLGPAIEGLIQSTDPEIQFTIAPGSTIEVWKTNPRGEVLGTAETACLARVTEAAGLLATIPLPPVLQAGDHVCLRDTTFDCWGPVAVIHAPFPRVTDHAPQRIDWGHAQEINLAVTGWTPATRVELLQGERRLPLDVEPVRAGIYRVHLPVLVPEWKGRAQLRVLDAATPPGVRHPRLQIGDPPAR